MKQGKGKTIIRFSLFLSLFLFCFLCYSQGLTEPVEVRPDEKFTRALLDLMRDIFYIKIGIWTLLGAFLGNVAVSIFSRK